ncbi:MAG: B12-binding domain-containing radical SAM protein, partial [Bacteroidales bacterium]|nr:B12-binding domain-containing radical SAM protein [Bacteroidales bacterium]
LINPVNKRRQGLKLDQDSIYPPMALGIIAALTPPHWEVEILDENFTEFEYKDVDLVGFTSLTATVNRCYELSTEYRKNKIPTAIGGIHASMLPEEAAQFMDTVVVGEAEEIWPKLIDDFEKNRLQKFYKAKLPSIVNSPSPRIDLYHPDYSFGSVQTTRGCPMSCEFCSVHTFNGSKYRLRSVEKSVEDFINIDKERIYIVDDNFVGYSKAARNHALEFFKGVAASGVQKQWGGSASMNIAEDEELLEYAAKSGCKLIFLGIESEIIDQLKQAKKKVNLKIGVDKYEEVYRKIHKYEISVLGAFIFGLDNDTPETIYNRASYILDADIDIIQASVLTPLPGTALFKRFEQEGRLLHTNFPEDWERYNYAEVVFQPNKMTPGEFSSSVYENWERLYEIKTLKRKFLRTLKLTNNPTTAAWAFSSNLQLRNFVFEGKKKVLQLDETFPQLGSKLELKNL